MQFSLPLVKDEVTKNYGRLIDVTWVDRLG